MKTCSNMSAHSRCASAGQEFPKCSYEDHRIKSGQECIYMNISLVCGDTSTHRTCKDKGEEFPQCNYTGKSCRYDAEQMELHAQYCGPYAVTWRRANDLTNLPSVGSCVHIYVRASDRPVLIPHIGVVISGNRIKPVPMGLSHPKLVWWLEGLYPPPPPPPPPSIL